MIVLDEFEPATWSVSISRTAWWGSESLLLVGVVSVSINVANFGAGVAREEDLAACPALDGIESLAVVLLAMGQRGDLVVALLAEVVPNLGLGSLPRVYDMLAVTRLQSEARPLCWVVGKLSSIDIPAIWQRVCGVDSGCDRTERPWGR